MFEQLQQRHKATIYYPSSNTHCMWPNITSRLEDKALSGRVIRGDRVLKKGFPTPTFHLSFLLCPKLSLFLSLSLSLPLFLSLGGNVANGKPENNLRVSSALLSFYDSFFLHLSPSVSLLLSLSPGLSLFLLCMSNFLSSGNIPSLNVSLLIADRHGIGANRDQWI